MLSKAVGVVLDMFAEDEAPIANITAFNWGNYAAETLAKSTETKSAELGPLASFARDLIAYATSHPEDLVANKYADQAVEKGS